MSDLGIEEIDEIDERLWLSEDPDMATARLIGPVLHWVMTGRDPALLDPRTLAEPFTR